MALSVATATKTKGPYTVGRTIVIYGTVAVTGAGGTYAPGGPTLSLAGLSVGGSKAPLRVEISGNGGATGSLFQYRYIIGTTRANGTMKIFCATSASTNIGLAEHSTATTHADVLTDTITFRAEFDKLI